MIEKLPAAVMFVICMFLLVRLFVGAPRQRRWDNALRRAWAALRGRALYVWHWRESRRRATLAAEEAIRRARARMERDGNVVRPDSFQKPRKPH
jgi:hypothetical protein